MLGIGLLIPQEDQRSGGSNNGWIIPGATVDLYFINGQYFGGSPQSNLTVTNSLGGYVTNSNGTITLVAPNTLRIGTGTGLLAEQAATNMIKTSGNQTGTGWGNFNVTPTVSSQLAPDNINFMNLQTVSSSSSNTSVNQLFAPSTATPYTMSAYFKQGSAGFFVLAMSDAGSNWAGASANATTLALTTSAGGDSTIVGSPSITSLANGIVRFSVTVQCSAAPSNRGFLFQGSSAALSSQFVAGVSGQTTFCWGCQIEPARYVSSYIPTAAAGNVTRPADVITPISTALTALAGGTGFNYYQQTGASFNSGAPSNSGIIQKDGLNLPINADVSTNIRIWVAGANTDTAFGSSENWLTGRAKVAAQWSPSGAAIVGGNGTIGTSAGVMAATASTPFVRPWNSTYIERLTFGSVNMTTAVLKALTAGAGP